VNAQETIMIDKYIFKGICMNVTIVKTLFSASLLYVTSFANAGLILDWEIDGGGKTTISEVLLGEWEAKYNNKSSFSGDWIISTTAQENGNFTFDWSLFGHHSWYRSQLTLTAFSSGMSEFLYQDSNAFNLSDTYTFNNLQTNEVFGFKIHGSHYDSSKIMRGTMNISQVPEPSGILLISLCIIGLTYRKLKK